MHPFPSTKDILQSISASVKCFASLDTVNGYFQVSLDEESSFLTTLLLPSGCYRYLSLPMGMSSLSDDWCRISDSVIEGFPWATNIMDDILIHTPDYLILHKRLYLVLTRCQEINLTISKSKLQIGDTINFAGHTISKDGIFPNTNMLKAITEFKQNGTKGIPGPRKPARKLHPRPHPLHYAPQEDDKHKNTPSHGKIFTKQTSCSQRSC